MKQYDYTNQAWYDTVTGRYIGCAHPSRMDCGCYGRLHEGQPVSIVPPLKGGTYETPVKTGE